MIFLTSIIEGIKHKSYNTFSFWENSFGWAPDSAANKLSAARLDWLKELTDCLEIWEDKGICLTNGELLLACSNLGALVEGWLKLFYCVYYEDYLRNPLKQKAQIVEPNDMSFEKLKQFSRGILWDQSSDWDKWIDRIQKKRNAIHAFNDRDIGTAAEYLDDIRRYDRFIDLLDGRLPYPD